MSGRPVDPDPLPPGEEGGEAACFAHLFDGPPAWLDDAGLARLVRSLADAVVIADAQGDIVFWNDAAERLFGWSAPEAVGRPLDLIIPERLRERHGTGFRRVMETGHTRYGDRLLEVPAQHRDGRRISIAFTVTLLTRPGIRRPDGIAAVIRDDTARWEERRRARADAAAAASTGTGEHAGQGSGPGGAGSTSSPQA